MFKAVNCARSSHINFYIHFKAILRHVIQQNTILIFTTMLKIIILQGMVAFVLTLKIFSCVKAEQKFYFKKHQFKKFQNFKSDLEF